MDKVDNTSDKKPYSSPGIKYSFSSREFVQAIDNFNEAMAVYGKVMQESIEPVMEAYNKWAQETGMLLSESASKFQGFLDKENKKGG